MSNKKPDKLEAVPGSLSHIVGGQLAPLATVTKALSRLAYRCSGNLLIARPSVLACAPPYLDGGAVG